MIFRPLSYRSVVSCPLLIFLALTAAVFAQNPPEWTDPFPPHRIAANLYYVGSADLASYLVTTPTGHILINSNLETSVPQIKESVEKLGFHFADIKILLISHAHFDHCAGSALLKKLTGAKYMVMQADVPVVEDGGRSDFQYGGPTNTHFPPAKVDRILHDGDTVRLGGMVLTAHLTAGHTKGCTTWTFDVAENGKLYHVVIIGSPNVNPGYKLVDNREYPQIAQDYEHTFETLKSLPCDIFLGAHRGYYDMQEKFAKLAKGETARAGQDATPFIDPSGYRAYVADREQAFREELARQEKEAQKNQSK